MVIDEFWKLNADNSGNYRFHGDPIIGSSPQYCEIYLQELNQIPTVNIEEKSLPAMAEGGEKESFKSTLYSSQQGQTSGETS